MPLTRPFSFYSGRFEIDLYEVPVIGPPQARHVAVSLFDYTCHHCKMMHERLLEAHRAFSNDLVIASLPMPLDPACNYTMRRTTPAHSNACDYARLGLAVWAADRTKHREFDDWLFAPESPPPLSEARNRAAALVGGEPLMRALGGEWVRQQLKLNVDIYATAYAAGQGSMPQLIVTTNIAVGTFSREELFGILEKNFGLKAAP
jgi:protein-disulfide isomerase